MAYYGWRPYVSVAQRRRQAVVEMQRLRKQGVDIQPVEIEGRKIAKTFWGQAWCDHMDAQGDLANRLPRGRRYARNGSVCHLAIERGRVEAYVAGSEVYNVSIRIDLLPQAKWDRLKRKCVGQIGSLLELLGGRISDSVMQVVTDPEQGLFPLPGEIELDCDCPDFATMCKHAAAVLYGVGARLDHRPERLFELRGVNHDEMVSAAAEDAAAQATGQESRRRRVETGELSDVFGIELESEEPTEDSPPSPDPRQRKRKTKQSTRRKADKSAKIAAQQESPQQSKKKSRARKKTAKKPAGRAAAKKSTAKKSPARKEAATKNTRKKAAKNTAKKRAASDQTSAVKGKDEKATTARPRAAKKKAGTKKKAKSNARSAAKRSENSTSKGRSS